MKKRISIITLLCLVTVAVFIFATAQRRGEIKHIVLISIDTCRADHLGCYGYPENTTPNIDAFATQATRFEHVISPAPITLPAHCSMLTGTIPPVHGVHNNTSYQLTSSNLTLPEILRQEGFNTGAIISSFVLDKKFGMNQGFDLYDDSFPNADGDHYGEERKGDKTTEAALDWLEQNRDEKSFLFLHYYDPHDPYEPPEPFASQFADHPYAGEIAFTDHCIGRVVRKLKDLGIYDSTLLIVTGDHGEMLGEHGEEKHAYFIYESAIRVPLIIKLPGQKEGSIISESVGLIDLVPMICALLDIEISTQVQGRDLSPFLQGDLPERHERFIYSESSIPTTIDASWLRAITHGQWKYIQAPRPELYDLKADPGEEHNLVEQEPRRARMLEDKIQEILEHSVRRDPESRIELDAESLKRLESLGYISGKSEGEIVFDKNQKDPKDLIGDFQQITKAAELYTEAEYEQAKIILEDLLIRNSDYNEIYLMLGDVEMALEAFDAAILYYRRALQLNPDTPMTTYFVNKLAWLQATRPSLSSRDVDEAVSYALRACRQTNFSDPATLYTLAVCYAAAEDFPKAVETARKAYDMAVAMQRPALAKALAARLKLFEQSKPYVVEGHGQSDTAIPNDRTQAATPAGAACCP